MVERDPELQSERGAALRALLYLFRRDDAVRTLRAGWITDSLRTASIPLAAVTHELSLDANGSGETYDPRVATLRPAATRSSAAPSRAASTAFSASARRLAIASSSVSCLSRVAR